MKRRKKFVNLLKYIAPGEIMYFWAHDKDITSYCTLMKIKVTTERGFFMNMRGETEAIIKVTGQ